MRTCKFNQLIFKVIDGLTPVLFSRNIVSKRQTVHHFAYPILCFPGLSGVVNAESSIAAKFFHLSLLSHSLAFPLKLPSEGWGSAFRKITSLPRTPAFPSLYNVNQPGGMIQIDIKDDDTIYMTGTVGYVADMSVAESFFS